MDFSNNASRRKRGFRHVIQMVQVQLYLADEQLIAPVTSLVGGQGLSIRSARVDPGCGQAAPGNNVNVRRAFDGIASRRRRG